MPMWRCPHCGTPQAEAARCWVCRRSSTSCGTCRHFRRAVAANFGYCGLDRTRKPLAGDELRGCWQEGQAASTQTLSATGSGGPGARRGDATGPVPSFAAALPRLEFVEVGRPADGAGPRPEGRRGSRRAGATQPPTTETAGTAAPPPDEPRWSLWGDPDR